MTQLSKPRVRITKISPLFGDGERPTPKLYRPSLGRMHPFLFTTSLGGIHFTSVNFTMISGPLQVAYILHGIHGQPLVGNAIIVGYLKQHLEGSDSGVANGCRRFPSLYLKKVQNLSMMTFDDINILVLNRFDWLSLSKVFFVCKIAGALLVMPFATWGSKLMAHFTKSAFGRGRFK